MRVWDEVHRSGEVLEGLGRESREELGRTGNRHLVERNAREEDLRSRGRGQGCVEEETPSRQPLLAFMSSTLSTGTPAMPTSPTTRGWSES